MNALSRIGWYAQINRDHPQGATPILQNGSSENDHLLHNGGQIWQRPSNISTQALKQEWFVYATAWQLSDPAIYISVAVLGIHLLIVLIHCFTTICTKQSSEAWNSISELLALAYTSFPERETLKNCGAGIMLQTTLRQIVKVVAVENHGEGGVQKVQLVPCDTQLRRGSLAPVTTAPIEINREYG